MNFTELVPSYFLSNVIANVEGQDIIGIFNANIYLKELLFDNVRRGKIYFSEVINFLYEIDDTKGLLEELQTHKDVKMNFVRDNPQISWDGWNLVRNPNFSLNDLDLIEGSTSDVRLRLTNKITFQDFLDNPDYVIAETGTKFEWNLGMISEDSYSRIPKDKLLENIDIFYKYDLFLNLNMTEDDLQLIMDDHEIIRNFTDLLAYRDDLNSKFIEKYYHLLDVNNIGNLMYNKNITEEFILNHLEDFANIDRIEFQKTPLISMRFISENSSDITDRGDNLSRSLYITIDDVLNYPTLPWRYDILNSNPALSIDDIIDNIEVRKNIGKNPNLNINNVQRVIDLNIPRFFHFFSENKSVSMKDIEDNPHLPWHWNFVSLNPNITLEFYLKYKDLETRMLKFPNSEGDFKINHIGININRRTREKSNRN